MDNDKTKWDVKCQALFQIICTALNALKETEWITIKEYMQITDSINKKINEKVKK